MFTYVAAGGVELAAATLALARITVASIDLSSPEKSGEGRGVHPRIGALDVVPVVPISPTATLEQAAEIARIAAAALATTLSLLCISMVQQRAMKSDAPSQRCGAVGLSSSHHTRQPRVAHQTSAHASRTRPREQPPLVRAR